MSRFKTSFEAALYLWDYFYCANVPHAGDEKAWGTIERALGRLRERENFLRDPYPPDIRLRAARSVRSDTQRALRAIRQLSSDVEPWVVEELERFAQVADALVAVLATESAPLN